MMRSPMYINSVRRLVYGAFISGRWTNCVYGWLKRGFYTVRLKQAKSEVESQFSFPCHHSATQRIKNDDRVNDNPEKRVPFCIGLFFTYG